MQIIQSNMLLNCKQFWCHSFVVHSKSIFSCWVVIFCSSTYTWSWQSYQWALFLNCCLFFLTHKTAVAFVVGVGGGCTKVLKEFSLRIPFSSGCSPWPRNSARILFGACWQRLRVRGNYIRAEMKDIGQERDLYFVSFPLPYFHEIKLLQRLQIFSCSSYLFNTEQ